MTPKNHQPNGPWKGILTYTEADEEIFHGRREATNDVVAMIECNLIVTLYGKSGVGKSSLLNAGVFPRLRRDSYLPIITRIDRKEKSSEKIIAAVIDIVNANCAEHGVEIEMNEGVDSEFAPTSLREFFATRRFYIGDKEIYPVIVFDQFEELLLNNPIAANELLTQFHQLMDRSRALPTGSHTDTNYRIVVALREDDFYLLEDSIDRLKIPKLKQNRFRLTPLTVKEALEVIEEPDNRSELPIFNKTERDEIADKIIQLSKSETSGAISSHMLSLICRTLYDNAQKKSTPEITKSDLDAISSNPLGDYYNRATKNLSKFELRSLEKALVDQSGRRLITYRNRIGVKNGHLQELFEGDHKIIQNVAGMPVTNSDDDRPIELVHDQLAKAIVNCRQQRTARSHPFRVAALFLSIIGLCFLLLGYSITTIRDTYYTSPFSTSAPLVELPLSNNFAVDSIVVDIDSIDNYDYVVQCGYLKKIRLTSLSNSMIMKKSLSLEDLPNLVDIELPKNLRSLRIKVENCPNLAPIKIPASVDTIEIRSSLYEIRRSMGSAPLPSLKFQIDSGNQRFRFYGGILWDMIDHRYTPFRNEDTVMINLPDACYYTQSQLYSSKETSIIDTNRFTPENRFNKHKDYIVEYADKSYSGELDLSDCDFKYLSDSCFNGMTNMTSIVLPKELEYLYLNSFSNCPSLQSITLGDNINGINGYPHWSNNIEFKAYPQNQRVSVREGFVIIDNKIAYPTVYTSVVTTPFKTHGDTLTLAILGDKYATIDKNGNFITGNLSDLESRGHIRHYRGTTLFANRLFNHKPTKKIYLPSDKWFFKTSGNKSNTWYFDRVPIETTELHLPFENRTDKNPSLYLPDSTKRHINLYVPKGSRERFLSDPKYQAFKSINEDSEEEFLRNTLESFVSSIIIVFKMLPWVLPAIIVGLIALIFATAYFFKKKLGKLGINSLRLRRNMFVYATLCVAAALIFYLSLVIALLMANVGGDVAEAISIIVALCTLWLMVVVVVNLEKLRLRG